MIVTAASSPIPPLRMKSMILLTSALLLLLSSSLCEPTNSNYLACKDPTKFSCGGTDYNISFPFWAPGRDKNCSYPGFHLICSPKYSNHSMLIINIGYIADDYQVIDIDYDKRVLTVFDVDLIGVPCPASFSPTTLNHTLFELAAADSNLTLYKCSVDLLSSEGKQASVVLHRIPCDVSESPSKHHATSTKNSYYSVQPVPEPETESEGILEKCDVAVLPMKRTAVDSLEDGELEFPEAVGKGFGVTWVGKDWCKGCVDSGGACGYDSDTPDAQTCFCPNCNSTNGACPNSNSTNGAFQNADVRKRWFFRRRSVIGAIAGVSSLILLSLSFLVYSCRSKKFRNCTILSRSNPEKGQSIKSFLEKYGSIAPKRYTYSEVKKITKSFGDKLGEGGFGVVYKGSLSDDYPVAVKVLDATNTDGGQDFINEIASIGRTSHVNVVSLLGFCYEGSKRALVYDFMPNGSLDRFIYPERSEATITPLGWENLFMIAVGIARGLEYLHQGCNTRIVHFDIKPHNILLDQDLCPKISDFGLAKLCKPKESVISMCGARGTAGYIAPEVFSRNFGVVSSKSDVYSYGMMVLEMVGAREKKKTVAGDGSESEMYFPHWIYRHLDRNGVELKGWCGVTSETEGVARKMILVGLWCIQPRPVNRPSISRVLEMLEGSIGDLEMPPEPYLSSSGTRTPISSLSVSLLD